MDTPAPGARSCSVAMFFPAEASLSACFLTLDKPQRRSLPPLHARFISLQRLDPLFLRVKLGVIFKTRTTEETFWFNSTCLTRPHSHKTTEENTFFFCFFVHLSPVCNSISLTLLLLLFLFNLLTRNTLWFNCKKGNNHCRRIQRSILLVMRWVDLISLITAEEHRAATCYKGHMPGMHCIYIFYNSLFFQSFSVCIT